MMFARVSIGTKRIDSRFSNAVELRAAILAMGLLVTAKFITSLTSALVEPLLSERIASKAFEHRPAILVMVFFAIAAIITSLAKDVIELVFSERIASKSFEHRSVILATELFATAMFITLLARDFAKLVVTERMFFKAVKHQPAHFAAKLFVTTTFVRTFLVIVSVAQTVIGRKMIALMTAAMVAAVVADVILCLVLSTASASALDAMGRKASFFVGTARGMMRFSAAVVCAVSVVVAIAWRVSFSVFIGHRGHRALFEEFSECDSDVERVAKQNVCAAPSMCYDSESASRVCEL